MSTMDLEAIKIDSHPEEEFISEINYAYKNGVKSGGKFVIVYFTRKKKWKTVTFDRSGFPLSVHFGWPKPSGSWDSCYDILD